MAGWHLGTGIRNLLRKDGPTEAGSVSNEDQYGARTRPVGPPSTWVEQVPITGRKTLPPDPKVMRALGLNHTFESAVADIVDNSIDAEASKVLIRLVRNAHRLVGLWIVDDGKGMDAAAIDRAMTVGGRRSYTDADLGHFGMGLKAASLGQARVLTVVSKATGVGAVGRRWQIENASHNFECELLAEDYCESMLARSWQFLTPLSGTVVMWTEVKSFPHISEANSVDPFIDDLVTKLRQHIGLVFHRLLYAKAVEIAIDVEDIGSGEMGLCFPVEPINPFGYLRSGRTDYPRDFSTHDHSVKFKCHIWPGRSNHSNFRLLGGRPELFQGFYFYRNNRLLQYGGWNGVTHTHRRLQLARIEVDVTPQHATLFYMNAEKTRIESAAEFNDLVQAATDGATSFVGYLDDARATYRESQLKSRRERPKVIQPGKGFAKRVRKAVAEEYEFAPGDKQLSIRWADLKSDTFFDIDRDEMVIRLNKTYRSAILGGGDSSLNDAPLVKTLIYLLAEETFHPAFLGARARDNLSIWQSILTAAAQELRRNESADDE